MSMYLVLVGVRVLKRTLLVALFWWGQPVLPVAAQSFPPPSLDRGRPFGGPSEGRCAEVSVEPQIDMSRKDGGFERPDRVLDFTITVFVVNQCQEPIQLLQGSFVSYQTNFPPLVQEMSQPPECLGQQRSFSGLLPPLQKVPFAFRAQECTFPASQTESPRVTLETGRVVTDRGEKPIPSVTEVLP